jgi:hypothetical protein
MITPPTCSQQQSRSMAEVVDQGLAFLPIMDRDLVADFLLRRGVRVAVIARVLGEPNFRRRSRRDEGSTMGSNVG